LTPVKKGDFFPLFWPAWITSFTSKNILKSFEATGVVPPNADAVLKRFRNTTSDGDKGPELEPKGNKSSGIQLRKLFNATVKDQTDEARKELSASIHSLQAHNDILNTENEGLRQALTLKKKHKKKSKPLDLQQRKEYHGGAVFWSPSKLREARVHEQVNRQEEEAEKLQKAQTKELKAAAALYKKKIAEEAKALRESAKEARAEERKKAAEEAAARRTQKEQEKRDRDSQKALQQSQRGKRAASKPPKGRQEERRSNNRGTEGAIETQPAPPVPPKTTRTRSIKAPKNSLNSTKASHAPK
ncbi:hypothetical protein TUN199_11800, partial [Pyrenophora tritici-repentis]